MIYHKKGDLFLSNCDALCHGVNQKGIMGAGIALQFYQKYPEMSYAYARECKEGRLKTGGMWVWPYPPKTIINLCTQDGFNGATLENIEQCFSKLRQYCLDGFNKSIAMPYIGAGLGGLRWDDIFPIVYDKLNDLDNRVCIYEYGRHW